MHWQDLEMTTFSQFQPTPFDARGLGAENHNADWLVCPVSRTRDSGPLAESNFRVFLRQLEELREEAEYEVHRFGHWGPGWFEIIIVPPNGPEHQYAAETQMALADYPVLCEHDYSELEYEYEHHES